MAYIVGCDIGTTNTKITAFDPENAAILSSHAIGYEMLHPQPGWSELDPDEIYSAILSSMGFIVKDCAKHGPLMGISFSSAMHSVVAMDQQGKPMTNLIIWADNRSAAYAEELKKLDFGMEAYKRSGTPLHAMSPLCKLLWLKNQESHIFKNAEKFIGVKEYVIYRLIGNYVVDYSIASATGLFNLKAKNWDQQVLQYVGITEKQLSAPVSPYHIEKLASDNDLGLPEGTPLIMGASDGCLANLGSGAINSESLAVTIGTSAAIRVCADMIYSDPKMRTFCYILNEQTYVVGGASNNGAVIFEWLKEQFFKDFDFEAVFDEANDIPEGADGLLFYPYLLGERAPLWSSTVRGGFTGLDIQHKRAHFVRAVMEGILLNLFSIGTVLLDHNPIKTIYANGGFSKNKLWVQMLADVFGKTVVMNETADTGTVGAAMLGLKALGVVQSYDELKIFTPISVKFKPNMKAHQKYKDVYAKFSSQKDTFNTFS
jgi:gluconokinase